MVSAVITPGHLRRPDLLRFTLPECLRTIPESKRPALLRSRSKVNFLGGRRKHVSNGPRMSKGQKLTGKGCKLQPDADAIQGQFAIDSLYSSQDVVQQCRISHNASVVFEHNKLVCVEDDAGSKTSTFIVIGECELAIASVPMEFGKYVTAFEVQIELALWGSAGREHYDRLRPQSYRDRGMILVCFSIDSPDFPKNNTESWRPEARHFRSSVSNIAAGSKSLRNGLLNPL
nr:GTP-binding protein rhoC-like [Rhipicephalus microplus]